MNPVVKSAHTQTPRIHTGLPSVYDLLAAPQKQCIEHALTVLENISRTFRGESNTDTSRDKEKLLVEGQVLVSQSRENFRKGVAMLFALDENALAFPHSVKQLIGVLGLRLNEGLMPKTRGFWRTWDTPFKEQAAPGDVKEMLDKNFYGAFLEKFHNREQDPVEFAVWVERTLNRSYHPYSDGCGRITRALSTWILGRAGLLLPAFTSRDEYFDYLLKENEAESVAVYREKTSTLSGRS